MRLTLLLSILFLSLTAAAQPEIKPTKVLGCTPVKDQYLSATCWSFASNSFIESELLRMGAKETDLSEMFTARYAYLHKIQEHLKRKGQNFFTPGGQFHDVQWVLQHYGAVPETAYTGKPGGEINHDHGTLDTLVKRHVQKMLAEGKTAMDKADEQYIHSLFDQYLGKVPATFTWNDQVYTPAKFLKNQLKLNPADYIEITSYSHHPWYKPFVLENKYNWSYDAYMNVPLNDFTRITGEALEKGYTVLWNGDVNEAGFRYADGLAELDGVINDLVKERQRTFADSSSSLDHVMHIVGKTTDDKGVKWYYIKNSWGKSNSLDGFLYMDERYFAVKTAAIVVHKDAIPADIRKKIGR